MDIPSDVFSRVSPHSGARGWQAAQEAGQTAAFAEYLDVDRQRQKMRELPPGQGLSSVYMQFMEDYRAWKSRQPEAAPPDSQGWTEENLEFLAERFGGRDLSAFEIYDALETMWKQGILSRKALRCAEGNCLIAIDRKGGICRTNADPDSTAAWLHGFDEAPMTGFRTLDDILSWARDFREEDWPDFITQAEAMARGWI